MNTASNAMIKNAMKKVDSIFGREYESLIQTGSITCNVSLEKSFYEQANSASLWGLLVNAGYLTITDRQKKQFTLKIPNDEVAEEFKSLTMFYLNFDESIFTNVMEGLMASQKAKFANGYKDFVMLTPSYFDKK